jgi:hypothetical protein
MMTSHCEWSKAISAFLQEAKVAVPATAKHRDSSPFDRAQGMLRCAPFRMTIFRCAPFGRQLFKFLGEKTALKPPIRPSERFNQIFGKKLLH